MFKGGLIRSKILDKKKINKGDSDMDLSLECIYCTMNKADSLFDEHEADADKKLQFMKKVFGIIAESAPGGYAAFFSCTGNAGFKQRTAARRSL